MSEIGIDRELELLRKIEALVMERHTLRTALKKVRREFTSGRINKDLWSIVDAALATPRPVADTDTGEQGYPSQS